MSAIIFYFSDKFSPSIQGAIGNKKQHTSSLRLLPPSVRTDRLPTVRMTEGWHLWPSPPHLGLRLAIDDCGDEHAVLRASQLMGGRQHQRQP